MTQEELAETVNFQALFQTNYKEVLAEMKGQAIDVHFTDGAYFTFVEDHPDRGRFAGKVELGKETEAITSGTFEFYLPNGIEGNDAQAILDDAQMDVLIESAPGIREEKDLA